MADKKYTLNEDFFEDEIEAGIVPEVKEPEPVDYPLDDNVVIAAEPKFTDTPDEEVVNDAIETLLNNSIRREFESIDALNSDIATIKAETPNNTDIINILKTIITEKNMHVGMLTKALSLANGGEKEKLMNAGIEKAEEIISEPATTDLD